MINHVDELANAAERFVRWLDAQILADARGDHESQLTVAPSGRFWLGRLAPEESVISGGLGERGERLDPCAIGLRVKPKSTDPPTFIVKVHCRVWKATKSTDGRSWQKSSPIQAHVPVNLPDARFGSYTFGRDLLSNALATETGVDALAAEVRVDVETNREGGRELIVQFVNVSPQKHESLKDTNLYEARFGLHRLPTVPFVLEALPDSFRYTREVAAYGLNCGVVRKGPNSFSTTDTVVCETKRLGYWGQHQPIPDLTFMTLANNPLGSLRALVDAYQSWTSTTWSVSILDQRGQSEGWSAEMRSEAAHAAEESRGELARLEAGLSLLSARADLRQAFQLMNEAMAHAASGRYDGWRPFQIGFILTCLPSLASDVAPNEPVEVLWFPTGGGKTETYLGLLVTAVLFDRLKGKTTGSTAWSRFPLRMLSLQQTQRFADALAGAEIARLNHNLGGDPFSLGFLVGEAGTPNAIRLEPEEWQPDPNDDAMPARYQVLLYCPFCGSESLRMVFNRRRWTLEHRCENNACPWQEEALPFYIVDEEIYRFVPTVIVGTLDKVASIALQGAMRGLLSSPNARCSEVGHGYTYSPRSQRPNGCLVPGCRGVAKPLTFDRKNFGPSFRLQDELHLLRDSLGAVDSHYESLLDHLQFANTGTAAKVIASSATLAGFEKQTLALYRRTGRVFPLQGPRAESSFWLTAEDGLAKRFVAIAPRGVTTDYASDRLLTILQKTIRRFADDPRAACAEAGIDTRFADELVTIYGTNVVYGSTLRDIEAVMRSLESQVPVEPLVTAALTGRTPFEEVREALARLQKPEHLFAERIHVIAASSMMSHGVDIDRLNTMVMLGMPLSNAEFIQTTARIGRRWPGLVIVLHKIGRERDASVFRAFEQFVLQGDRFVEPIPITRRSRRVLDRTMPGLMLGRLLAHHEPRSPNALTTVKALRKYWPNATSASQQEAKALGDLLGFTGSADEQLMDDVNEWVRLFFQNLMDPSGSARFPSDLSPSSRPMISLRDVETQAPIRDVTE